MPFPRSLARALTALAIAALSAGLVTTPSVADPGAVSSRFDPAEAAPGWASVEGGTDGGAGAAADAVHVVRDRAELLAALDNGGRRTEPKIIYVVGTIHGNQAADGRLLGEQDYAPGYDLQRYLSCFGDQGWSDQLHPWCGEQRRWRQTGSNNLKRQIEISVPSRTTLVGVGTDAGFDQTNLMLHLAEDVVIRNLTIEAPVDHFTSWDPTDGEQGSWNARFDALSSVTSRHIWVDHVTFTDGAFPDHQAPVGPNGKPVNRHDGLFDMKDGTDLVTLSHSRLVGHDKTMLLGSGNDNADTDAGRLRITIMNNLFEGTQQRSPRVRYGQVHVINNLYRARTVGDHPMLPASSGGSAYLLGLGYESRIVSEGNVIEHRGPGADPSIALHLFDANRFVDRGSWYGSSPVDLNALAREQYAARVAELTTAGEPLPEWATTGLSTDVGWEPREQYDYRPITTAGRVRAEALSRAGAGRLIVAAPAG